MGTVVPQTGPGRMIGEGKYDAEAQELIERLKAKGLVLMVFEGNRGFGMSVKAQPHLMTLLPNILRRTADGIEREISEDLKELTLRALQATAEEYIRKHP